MVAYIIFPVKGITLPEKVDIWLTELKDVKGKARIVARIRSAELGNLGDVEPVGEGISEMRIHFGPDCRLYFA